MPGVAIAPRSITPPPPPLVKGFPIRTAATLLFFAVLWFVLCRHLSGEWSVNEQYNYGWFVPFFAMVLFWLRWEDRPEPAQPKASNFKSQIPNQRTAVSVAVSVLALFLLFPIRLFEIGNP